MVRMRALGDRADALFADRHLLSAVCWFKLHKAEGNRQQAKGAADHIAARIADSKTLACRRILSLCK